jgi:hypothetical protein
VRAGEILDSILGHHPRCTSAQERLVGAGEQA